jgi:hypothetical protein
MLPGCAEIEARRLRGAGWPVIASPKAQFAKSKLDAAVLAAVDYPTIAGGASGQQAAQRREYSVSSKQTNIGMFPVDRH